MSNKKINDIQIKRLLSIIKEVINQNVSKIIKELVTLMIDQKFNKLKSILIN